MEANFELDEKLIKALKIMVFPNASGKQVINLYDLTLLIFSYSIYVFIPSSLWKEYKMKMS